MILPFVREILADVEKTVAFQRAAFHWKMRPGPPGGMAEGRSVSRLRLSGLTPTAKALHLVLLHRATGRPIIVVVPRNRNAEDLLPIVQAFAELTAAAPASGIVYLPAHDVLPFENLSPHPEIQESRAAALHKIAAGQANIVLAPLEAAAGRVRLPEFYAGLSRTVRRGETLEPESLTEHLATVGYTRADMVEMEGQFALRGGILDVYPAEAERPVRMEFFGDEIDSIRRFDPGTQRSAAPVDEVLLLPLTETPVQEELLAAIHARLSGRRMTGAGEIMQEAALASGAGVFPGWEFYATLAGAQHSLFDLAPNALVLRDEPSAIQTEQERWWEKLTAAHEKSGVGRLATPGEMYFDPETLAGMVAARDGGELAELGVVTGADEQLHLSFHSQPTTRFHGSLPAVVEELRALAAAGKRVLFAASNSGEVERLVDIFTEYQLAFRLGSRNVTPGAENYLDDSGYYVEELNSTTVVKVRVPEGVALPESGLVIFGYRDLFDDSEAVVKAPQRLKSKTSAFLSDFRDLAVGDYVVHVEHGIGQYQGLKEIPQGDSAGEFMVLGFAEGAKLYVPLTRLDLIQKYRSSSEGAPPPQLSRLGGAQWQKTTARVKKAMRDMADELLKLYAQRKTVNGHAFPADTQWQREFEDAFEHNETDDQTTAIADIKRDMESPQPMDRLLCGDVGYGKTEVAMRAAFKAVSDNKQVAVLTPTTVLSFQHYEIFKQRFAAFPLTIEMISRFRTPKQQKEILEKLEHGKVDILIGTHRLLSKDVKFHDLGLVVVDEEQRFGVAHKERLKQLRKQVDVLTMSATPIPRTLHMSLVGLRDMSVIETPPRDRMAIQTVVAAFDEDLTRSAIEQELERGGQVYFVHNRVESIYEIAAKLQELVPKARILVGHGQLSEGELEKVMLAFMRHQADILVATTIIENGLDIPLCNTILINRADRHGLSELYQLRGRVGRSNRRAYAYLMIPAEAELTPVARRRLAALKEFSDLGAGFKIAALDLELRGAGNLLGGEQSGHIDAVGFEMYTTMLERTVRELKGEISEQKLQTQLNLALNLRLPNEYIGEENQRLRMYKRIAGVENEKQLDDVRAELHDRYGAPPSPARNLLEAAALKLLCERIGVAGIDRKGPVVHIRFTEDASIDPERLALLVARQRGAQFTPAGVLKLPLRSTDAEQVLRQLAETLTSLSAVPTSV